MCGIWALIGKLRHANVWEAGVKRLSARGPEGYKIVDVGGGVMAFTRLAINGLRPEGMQPFSDSAATQGLTWICNGEIYNWRDLGVSKSGSDCEVLGQAWVNSGKSPREFARSLDGVFAIVLYDAPRNRWIIARDPYGVRPLFYMRCGAGLADWMFASERKVLEPFAQEEETIWEFPPGHVLEVCVGDLTGQETWHKYHEVPWLKMPTLFVHSWRELLRDSLVSAVRKRVEVAERPIAALLSGGVDSSLIAALVQRELKGMGRPPLKTFSIGMRGSTDLAFARKVAAWIGSDHTEVIVTAQEMFDAIPKVIYDIESYDITTVRASVGNWLVSKAIAEQTDCKIVFNGDGSDEVFGSYLYFYRAPSDIQFEAESARLLEEISKYDVLRSDRSISSHGLEPRTPFLDKQFVAVARSLPTNLRRPLAGSTSRCEKWCLRAAFEADRDEDRLLPPEVLWRRKEAFSDGVSGEQKSWFEEIQERISVPDDWESIGEITFSHPKPHTKEAFYYRTLYERFYKYTGDYWAFWMPRWSGETRDPSARTLSLY